MSKLPKEITIKLEDKDLLSHTRYNHLDIINIIWNKDNGEIKRSLFEYLREIAGSSIAEIFRVFALKMHKDNNFNKFYMDIIIKVSPMGENKECKIKEAV